MSNPTAQPQAFIKSTTTANFRNDVIAESMKMPVLVDFWAPWCGPCKQLTPILERIVQSAGGKIKLVTMNIEEHPQIAGQMGVQSIPAVFAFQKGQPIDGFMGALPESQVKAFVERLVGPLTEDLDGLLAEAETALTAQDLGLAVEKFTAVLDQDESHLRAIGGLARTLIAAGEFEQATSVLTLVPEGKANDPAIVTAKAALDLALKAADLGDLAGLEKIIADEPDNFQARFDLALGLNALNRQTEAADHLLYIIKRDRKWQDDGARKQLLQFFESWGPMDPASVAGRRKLSVILFS
jgi:putative thioredoxin